MGGKCGTMHCGGCCAVMVGDRESVGDEGMGWVDGKEGQSAERVVNGEVVVMEGREGKVVFKG